MSVVDADLHLFEGLQCSAELRGPASCSEECIPQRLVHLAVMLAHKLLEHAPWNVSREIVRLCLTEINLASKLQIASVMGHQETKQCSNCC